MSQGKRLSATLAAQGGAIRAFCWEGAEEEQELEAPKPEETPCPPHAEC